ncbi:polysaccharide deacetylase family protein [Streptomyces sp. NPDC046215]|uniref:NodB homology domain-containing protein n=1 Tax=Streptomyces stramineus TaxID=173861 RepID=A0ABN1B4J2_9ACTN
MNRARSSAFRLGRGLLAAALALGAMAPADREHPGARTAPAAVRAPAGPVDRLFGQEVRRIPTSRRVVALTFNAAWDDGGVAEVLTVLRERRAPATFFPTGDFAERHPRALRAMAARHGLGNHSHSHPLFDGLPRARVAEEVTRADRAIRAAAGAVPLPFFRFPFSATTPAGIAQVNDLGFADIEFTTDTNGYLGPAGGMTVAKAVTRALAGLAPGHIVQMHVGSPGGGPVLDARALPAIIDAVRARGYRIVDLRTLLGPAPGAPRSTGPGKARAPRGNGPG